MRQYPFIVSSTFIDQLIADGLIQYSDGDPKLIFSVPMHFFDELDVFYNFRWQNLMGISAAGAGEAGRYYYIESLDYDFMGDRINVVAIDMEYIVKKYFILGDEGVIAGTYSAASDVERIFGYLCDEATWRFSNGDPGKALVDEGLLEDY